MAVDAIMQQPGPHHYGAIMTIMSSSSSSFFVGIVKSSVSLRTVVAGTRRAHSAVAPAEGLGEQVLGPVPSRLV